MTRDIKYGACGHMFDPDLNRAVAGMYDEQGYDFMIWSDQMCLTIPRSHLDARTSSPRPSTGTSTRSWTPGR